MGVAARSRERVEAQLDGLERTYGSFSANQTTLSLPASRYRDVRERSADGLVDAFVAVRNDDADVLHVAEGETLTLPGTATGVEEDLEAGARRAVEDATGLTPEIDGLHEVTITGVRNADDADVETVFRLVVVFRATPTDGSVPDRGEWAPGVQNVSPASV